MRINFLWIILTAILLLIGGLFVFQQIGENTVTGSLNAIQERPIQVAILQSDNQKIPVNQETPQTAKDNYQNTINRWTRILLQPRVRHTYLTDQQLLKGALKDSTKFDVLIVPSARMLSSAQETAIKDFAKNGGGVWLSWATGVYHTHKKWKGWEFLEKLMGVKVHQDKTENLGQVLPFLLYGNTPFTTDIPAGYRLHLGNYHQPIKLEVQHPDTKVGGSWYATDSTITTLSQQVGLIYKPYGKGRMVYMGFEPDVFEAQNGQIGLTDEDEQVLKRFFWNGLQWLSKTPMAGVSTWKYGHQAAATVGIMTENNTFEWKKHPLPFSIYSRKALNLNAPLEVGVWGQSSDMDREEAMQEVRNKIAKNAVGIYTDEALNGVLRLILSASGYSYGVTKTKEPYWSVPRVLPNRVNEFVQIEAPTDSLTQIKDVWQTFASGGFIPLFYKQSYLDKHPKIKEDVSKLLSKIQQNQFWIATGAELSDWLRTRSKLSAQIHKYNQKRLGVQIINNGGAVVDSVALYIYLDKPFNKKLEILEIRPEDVWETFVRGNDFFKEGRDFKFTDAQNTVLQIRIKNLKPYQFRAYQIDRIQRTSCEGDANCVR